jgi:hypothetical protein
MDGSKLIKCGFNTYFDKDTGFRYEIIGGEFSAIDDGLVGELERKYYSDNIQKELSTINKNGGPQ